MEQSFVIKNPTGLHARPAALLVKKAASFPCDITVVKGEKRANAKSLMSVLALGITANDGILVIASGEKEEEALASIGELLASLDS